jgi:hypothetical protein
MGKIFLMKIACVTTTFVPDENYFETVKLMLRCYNTFKTDCNYQQIIVDNNSLYQKWLDFLDKESFSFPIIIHRDNRGMAPGGYKYAFEKLKDGFEYFLFHEQDIAPIKDYWLEEIVDTFKRDPQAGAVGNYLEYVSPFPELNVWHLDGAFIFTSTKILEKYGIDIHNETGRKWDALNEVRFTKNIFESGLKLIPMNPFQDNFHARGTDFHGYNTENIAPMININYQKSKLLTKYLIEKGLIT